MQIWERSDLECRWGGGLFSWLEAATAFLVELVAIVGVGGLLGLGLRDGHRDGVRCCLGERDWKYWTGSRSERGQEHQG